MRLLTKSAAELSQAEAEEKTAVPAFYEKLGARIVTNRFFNSSNRDQPEQSPWWDPHVMIYPSDRA